MTDIEELVRATLADRADDAPTPERLADSVRKRRHRSRRTRQALAVVAVAAATAAAVVIPLTMTGSPKTEHDAVTAPPVKAFKDQVIGFHGIELTVPATWKMNDLTCATPTSDTVIRDTGGTTLCLIARPPRVNSVELLDNPRDWLKQMKHVSTVTNDHGVSLRRGTVVGQGTAVVVPSVGVLALVRTTTPALADRIINSIDITNIDSTGCKMQERQLDPPSELQLRRGPFVPHVIDPTATSIAVCHYEHNWLVSSAVATGAELANIVHQANVARTGFVHANPADYLHSLCTDTSSGGEAGSGYVLRAHLASGVTQMLWAHIGSCGPLGITNGQRAGALTLALAKAINAPLHRGFAIPGDLRPGPPP